ncbi:hypothetical protein KAU11_08510 [Candidatus Babeliales bacterium]|nr:hypothetical protein [Candidatus Babeliales bacterium]
MFFNKYKDKLLEYSIVIMIVGLGLAYFNNVKNKKIIRLNALLSIQNEHHMKEIDIINKANIKEKVELAKVQKKYDLQIKDLNLEYQKQLDLLSKQQTMLYKKYISNHELIISDIEKVFNIKGGK